MHDIRVASIDMAATEGNEHDFYSSENDIMNKELKGSGGEVKNMSSATKLLLMEPRRAILLTVIYFKSVQQYLLKVASLSFITLPISMHQWLMWIANRQNMRVNSYSQRQTVQITSIE